MNDLRQPMYCGAWRSSSPVAKIYERELWSLPHTADCFSENSIASDPGFSQPCSTPQDRERFSFKKKFGILYHQACWVHFVVFRNGGRFEHFRGRRTIQFSKPVLPRPFSPQLTVFEGKTRVGCTLRHPFLFTFAYIKYIIVIKSSQLLSQIKFTPKYIFLYSWLILQSCTVWHQILVPLANEKTNPF